MDIFISRYIFLASSVKIYVANLLDEAPCVHSCCYIISRGVLPLYTSKELYLKCTFIVLFCPNSHNHRMPWVERDHPVPTPCCGLSCQLLNQGPHQAAQGPIQPVHGHLRGWSTPSSLGSLEQQTEPQRPEAKSRARWGLPVDPIVGRLYGAVHLQCGLVVHVGQREALQRLIGSRSPEQRLDGKRGQAERAVMGREKVAEGGEASGSSLLPCNGTCPVSAERPGSVLIQQCQTVGNGLGAVSFPTVTN